MDNREIRKLLTLGSNFTSFALSKRKRIRAEPQSPPPSEFICDGLGGQEPINIMGSCGGPYPSSFVTTSLKYPFRVYCYKAMTPAIYIFFIYKKGLPTGNIMILCRNRKTIIIPPIPPLKAGLGDHRLPAVLLKKFIFCIWGSLTNGLLGREGNALNGAIPGIFSPGKDPILKAGRPGWGSLAGNAAAPAVDPKAICGEGIVGNVGKPAPGPNGRNPASWRDWGKPARNWRFVAFLLFFESFLDGDRFFRVAIPK